MRFSIITIALNAEKYISETLRSTQSQNFTDFEHLVWDGGSKDNTISLAQSFKHVRVLQGKDSGISDAMNQASNHAQGDYLLFLHADDRLPHPNVLNFVHLALMQHNPLWLYGKVGKMDEKGEAHGTYPFVFYRKGILQKYNMISHPGVFIKRDFFKLSGGYRTDLRYAMDYELWIRLSKLSAPFPFPIEIACFREHKGSLSTSLPIKVAKEAHEIRKNAAPSFYYRYLSYRTMKRRIKIADL